jgi:hypothetical protein
MYYEIERKGNSQLSIINMLILITFSILSFLSRRQLTVFFFFSNSKNSCMVDVSRFFFFVAWFFLNFDFKCHNYKCLNMFFPERSSNRVFRVLFVFVDELLSEMLRLLYNFNFFRGYELQYNSWFAHFEIVRDEM